MTNPTLPPVPDQARSKLHEILPAVRKNNLKGMVCPAGGLTTSLFLEGLLSKEEIIGLLDNDETKHGTVISGLPVNAISSLKTNPPDFVVVASMSFNREIMAQLLPFSRRYGFKLLDLCSTSDPSFHTLPFVNSRLGPIPRIVLENLEKHLPSLIASRSRVLLYSDHPLTMNLWRRGIFADVNVTGIIDRAMQVSGSEFHGLRAYSPDQIEMLDADAILVTNPKQHCQIVNDLRPYAPSGFPKIIDLCEGLTSEAFRSEWAESLGKQIWANQMEEVPHRKVQVWTPCQDLCDAVCALSAARAFARRQPELTVQFQYLPEIIEAYGDELVRHGTGGYLIPDHSRQFLNERETSIAGNYLGAHHLSLGLNFRTPPRPELPPVPLGKTHGPRSYMALMMGVMSSERLKSVAAAASLPIVCIGYPGRKRPRIKRVEYADGSPIEMLRLIRHAAVVLTARNAAAHIAAGYDVPAIVWVPGDGYEWHINYAAWNHRRVRQGDYGFLDRLGEAIDSLMHAREVSARTIPARPPLESFETDPMPLPRIDGQKTVRVKETRL